MTNSTLPVSVPYDDEAREFSALGLGNWAFPLTAVSGPYFYHYSDISTPRYSLQDPPFAFWRSTTAMAFRRAPNLVKTLDAFSSSRNSVRGFNSLVSSHTAKWMQDTSKKSPMELINEVPPIEVEGRIVACEGDNDPALGHPIEFICLDLKDPAICKYCGLRYVQHDHHH